MRLWDKHAQIQVMCFAWGLGLGGSRMVIGDYVKAKWQRRKPPSGFAINGILANTGSKKNKIQPEHPVGPGKNDHMSNFW